MASASPLRSASHKSAMTPPELVSGAEANAPPRKRNTRRAAWRARTLATSRPSSVEVEATHDVRRERTADLKAEIWHEADQKYASATVALGKRAPDDRPEAEDLGQREWRRSAATKMEMSRIPTSSDTCRSSMMAGMRFDGADDAKAACRRSTTEPSAHSM